MDFGAYGGFIWSAYAIAGASLAALFAATVWDLRRQAQRLAEFER